jgi:DNA polymerase family B
MSQDQVISVPIGIRVYPDPPDRERRPRSDKRWQRPTAMLVFDTETRIDASQRLMFGSYRFIETGVCLEEGLFYADDLPSKDQKILERFVANHKAEATNDKLQLLARKQFLNRFYTAAYKARCLVVGFNLPFDLSRIAYDFTSARGRFAGGFSLGIWSYTDTVGVERANQYRPRLGIKRIDSKRNLIGFTARNEPDKSDLIREESLTGEPEAGYKFRGHFLDLRTLAFALTDRGYSLETACEAFGVEHGKQCIKQHGIITEEYIDYNRRDVLATAELAAKLLEEYDKHPLLLQVTKVYSPASIGKAYLRAMGIDPILERQPNFPKEYLGYAQSAFFGGRTSAHIRKVPVPVVYTDFLSMYPTVNLLMNLWAFVIAEKIQIVKHCGREIQQFLNRVTVEDLFDPATWKYLPGFVKLVPDSDVLPSRAKYSQESNDWQVGINHLYCDAQTPLWFTLPDVLASVVLTGRIPKVIDAFRIAPGGTLHGLQPVKLRGAIDVDPKAQDFFKVVIEERKRISRRVEFTKEEKERLGKALKVLANATSYGIYAEMNRQESDREVTVNCHGIDSKPFCCRVAHPDIAGEFCFPPVASLITGAARLMLALLERNIRDIGGTYAMEDTDSMAIVATERGGPILCPGGPIKALSWEQVRAIAQRFALLSPYDPTVVSESILKIEEDNFDPKTRTQRQLYCLAISAKRYALFLRNAEGTPVLLRTESNNNSNRWSEHGLGHLLNPSDPESDDREWIAQVWQRIILKALELPTKDFDFEARPAVGRVSVSSPAVSRPLANLNHGKKYADQVKPFNFFLLCHVMQLGHPVGVNPTKFHLVSPYETTAKKWLETKWLDQYSGNLYSITTTGCADRHRARVKTYGDIAAEYEFHPESKCADGFGKPCAKQTVGLLQRLHIRIDQIKYVGKESNSLEEVDQGLIHSAQSVYTEYPDPRRDEWQTIILPALKKISLSQLEEMSGLSRRTLIYARVGRKRPHQKNQEILSAIVKELAKKSARSKKRNVKA